MIQNFKYDKFTITKQLLQHLNTNCSYGNVFEIKIIGDPQNKLSLIVLRYQNKNTFSFYEILQENLNKLFIAFPKLCIKQIIQVKDEIIPNCFLLQISLDQVTKQQLSLPFKILNSDKLISCPMFSDFQVFLEKIQQSKNLSEEINNIDADEFYVISLMWEIRSLLNNYYKNQAPFEFILYPKNHNFGICKKQDNNQIIYFHSLKHKQNFFQQNSKFASQSTAIYEALKTKKIIETQVNLFYFSNGKQCYQELEEQSFKLDNQQQSIKLDNQQQSIKLDNQQQSTKLDNQQQSDKSDNQQYSDKSDNQQQSDKSDNLLKIDYENLGENVKIESIYLQISDQKQFKQIKLPNIIKNPILCQSILCLNNDLQNDLQHFIIFEKNVNPKCQCGREFDPYSFDTLIIDYKLMKAFDTIIIDLLLQFEQFGLKLFQNPLFMEIERDQYDNYFIVLFIKQGDKNKLKLKSHFFEGTNLNFNLHLIEDKEDSLDKLLGEEEIYNESDEKSQGKSDQETKMTSQK